MIDVQTPPIELEAPPEETEATTLAIPNDQKAEEATLGAVLINPACYPELATILKPADFYIHRRGWIWQALGNLTSRGEPLDILTIEDELNRMGQLEEIGGPAYLTALLNQVPTSLHAKAYARQVKDKANRRRLILAANEIATLGYSERLTAEQVSARAMEIIQENTHTTGDIILRTLADAFEMHPPRQWVIENLIMEKTVTIIYADAGSKKTYICITLGLAVASGLKFLAYTTHQAPVLYLDEENGSDEMDDRIKQIALGMGCDQNAPFYHFSYAGLMLDVPANCQTIKDLIERVGARLVILDSLQDFMTGDENSKEDTQPIFTSLKRISNQTGAAFWVQHHSGKNGDYRGSTTIKGNVDLMLEVKSEDDSGLITFRSKKNRKGTPIRFSAEALWVDETFTLKPSTQAAAHSMSKAEDYVISFLTDHPGATVEEVMNNAIVCTRSMAKKTLYNLAGRHLVRRTNPGEKEARYEVSPVTDVLPESYQ